MRHGREPITPLIRETCWPYSFTSNIQSRWHIVPHFRWHRHERLRQEYTSLGSSTNRHYRQFKPQRHSSQPVCPARPGPAVRLPGSCRWPDTWDKPCVYCSSLLHASFWTIFPYRRLHSVSGVKLRCWGRDDPGSLVNNGIIIWRHSFMK